MPRPSLSAALLVVLALALSSTTNALPARHGKSLEPFGVVVSPKNGFLLDPRDSLHFQYALAHPAASVTVQLISYDPFVQTELGEEEASVTLAEFLVTDPRHHRGYIDVWLGIPVDDLARPYDGKTFKLLVTESEVDFAPGKSFAESPFIKIQPKEGSEAFNSAQLLDQADKSREGLAAHYP